MIRRFLSRRIPDLRRVLLVESGTRELFDRFLPALEQQYGHKTSVDLVTCFSGEPAGFRHDKGRVYRVTDYVTPDARKRLFAELKANRYDGLGIICSGEPIMTKWKWVIAARVPAKLFVMNENGDYFWADRSNWRTVVEFVLFRAGLSGAEAVPALGRLLLFPFTVAYLAAYAAYVHARRSARIHG